MERPYYRQVLPGATIVGSCVLISRLDGATSCISRGRMRIPRARVCVAFSHSRCLDSRRGDQLFTQRGHFSVKRTQYHDGGVFVSTPTVLNWAFSVRSAQSVVDVTCTLYPHATSILNRILQMHVNTPTCSWRPCRPWSLWRKVRHECWRILLKLRLHLR